MFISAMDRIYVHELYFFVSVSSALVILTMHIRFWAILHLPNTAIGLYYMSTQRHRVSTLYKLRPLAQSLEKIVEL